MKTQVSMIVYVNWIGGTRSFQFDSFDEVRPLHAAKKRVLSELGVTESVFDAWIEADGRVRCNAKTAKGTRCKCYVSGLQLNNPRDWHAVEKIGGYCNIHGGE